MSIRILADASLPLLTEAFPEPFQITTYRNAQDIPGFLADQSILLCRSTLPINLPLIATTKQLKIVATASSGTDHIDQDILNERAIQLFDAKGSNADSVADYVLASLAYLRKHCHFKGYIVGIIGVGAVGSAVANRLKRLGLKIIYFDPVRALNDNSFQSDSLEALQACELICVHANLHDKPPYPSRHLINRAFLEKMAPGSAIINAARGNIVDEQAIIEKLSIITPELRDTAHLIYCTDVYANEPAINPQIVQHATLCTPHIAGHSIEAKVRAVTMLSQKIHAYYRLTPPTLLDQKPSSETTSIDVRDFSAGWEQKILDFYDPMQESLVLKQASTQHPHQCHTEGLEAKVSIAETFMRLRRQHQFRHELISP